MLSSLHLLQRRFIVLVTILLTSALALPTPNITLSPIFNLRCGLKPCDGIEFQDPRYVCGDPRLGPVILPRLFKYPLNVELATYDRFGDLCPAEFLAKWARGPGGSFSRPPFNGFQLDVFGKPILANVTLPAGKKLDRFGSEMGTFLSPLGAPYIERSLPPSNLNTFVKSHPFNYFVYEVLQPLVVQEGPVAAFYEQPGGGSQYVAPASVADLISGGFLTRLNKKLYDDPDDFSDNYTPGPL